MSRTTLDIQDNLLREAKSQAAREGRTLTKFIEDSLRERLTNAKQGTGRLRRLPTLNCGQVLPDIDLSRNAQVTEYLDENP